MSLPTIWQNDALISFLKDAGYTKYQWNDGLKEYLVFLLSASPYLTINDLLKLYYDTYGTWEIQFTPDDLFVLGQKGFWWDATSTNYITQDSLGTIPVTGAGEPIGLLIDRSSNGNDGIQATTARKPTYQISPSRAVFDKVDDYISTTISDTIEGTLLVATNKGAVHCDINVPVGTWRLPKLSAGFHGSNFTSAVLRDGYLSQSELVFLKDYLDSNTPYTPTGTDLARAFTYESGITRIYTEDWNVSGITTLTSFVDSCTSLTSLDLSNWTAPLLTNISYMCWSCTALSTVSLFSHRPENCIAAFQNCTSLTTLDISLLDTYNLWVFSEFVSGCTNLQHITLGEAFINSLCVDYYDSFINCALDQDSVDNILININLAGTSNGDLHIHLGTNATPSIAGKAATDALRARGWTVMLNGY